MCKLWQTIVDHEYCESDWDLITVFKTEEGAYSGAFRAIYSYLASDMAPKFLDSDVGKLFLKAYSDKNYKDALYYWNSVAILKVNVSRFVPADFSDFPDFSNLKD